MVGKGGGMSKKAFDNWKINNPITFARKEGMHLPLLMLSHNFLCVFS